MSYCRWSSDDYRCDVYAYQSCYGGYEINVAGSRHKGDVPRVPPIDEVSKEAWSEAMKTQREYLSDCELEDIGLPYDGQSFNVETLEELYFKLQQLRETGYHVPQYVFTRIMKEMQDVT